MIDYARNHVWSQFHLAPNLFHLAKVLATTNSEPGLALQLFICSFEAYLKMFQISTKIKTNMYYTNTYYTNTNLFLVTLSMST